MTYFPDYLKTYPNMETSSPLHISLNTLTSGFRAHRHDFLEFSYVISGSGSESINGVLHPMNPGTFTFVLPYQVHQIFTDPGSILVLYNCMFSMDMLMEAAKKERLFDLIDAVHKPSFAHFHGDERKKMDELIEDMYKEYKAKAPWKEALLQIRLKELLIRFDRYRSSEAYSVTSISTDERQQLEQLKQQQLEHQQVERQQLEQQKDEQQQLAQQLVVSGNNNTRRSRQISIWPIIHYIHQHYQDDLTLTDLAKRFNMSISRISEVIKEATGQNFLHFLHDLRIRHACSLLVSTEMSISEVALEVGYGSYNTFSRVFKDSKGVVPTQYRKSR